MWIFSRRWASPEAGLPPAVSSNRCLEELSSNKRQVPAHTDHLGALSLDNLTAPHAHPIKITGWLRGGSAVLNLPRRFSCVSRARNMAMNLVAKLLKDEALAVASDPSVNVNTEACCPGRCCYSKWEGFVVDRKASLASPPTSSRSPSSFPLFLPLSFSFLKIQNRGYKWERIIPT